MQGNRTWNVAQGATHPPTSLDSLRRLSAQQMQDEIREVRNKIADLAEIPSMPANAVVRRFVRAADRPMERLS